MSSNNVQVKAPKEDFRYQQFLDSLTCKKLSKKVGVALFGAGRAGMIHLGNLMNSARVNLLYVVEAEVEKLKKVEAATGLVSTKFVCVSEADEVLNDPAVEAVVITTPTPTHHDLVIKALENGKAVFCEKPIANRMSDIKHCYDYAKEKGLPLYCAFNRRFDPSFMNVKERVEAGEIGKVHMIKSCSRDSPLPSIEYLKISNGIFHDCAVHDIDLTCWMVGEYPTTVFASAQAHMKAIAEIDDHDTVAIQMNFPSGAMAVIDLSRFAAYGYDQRLEVFGPTGMLHCANQNAIGVQAYKGTGVTEAPIWYSFASRYDEAYKRELEHFLNVVEGKEDLKVLGHETLSVCKVASACEESVRTGMPVTVKYDF